MRTSQSPFTTAHYFYGATLLAASLSLSSALGSHLTGLLIATLTACVWWRIFVGTKFELLSHRQAARKLRNQPSDCSVADDSKLATSRLSAPALATPAEWIAIAFVAGLTIGLLLTPASNSDRLATTSSNLRAVADALWSYEQTHGSFPPPVTFDSQGKPMHSWRVFILPQLGERELFAEYRLNEPWNSPHNIQFADYCPPQFQSLSNQLPLRIPGSSAGICAVSADGKDWLRDESGRAVIVADSGRKRTNWLQPTFVRSEELARLDSLAHPLAICNRGFFATEYLTSLAATDSKTRVKLAGTALASIRVIHFANFFRLTAFLFVVFYPVRWLHRLRERLDSNG